jgi:hypothetical protein
VEPAPRLRLLFAGTLVLVPVAPFALLIVYALGAEDAFVTSFQWHALVLVLPSWR